MLHAAYLYAFERVVIPALYKFKPNLIIVASGFDAGGMDPLARMLCDGETFRKMTKWRNQLLANYVKEKSQ